MKKVYIYTGFERFWHWTQAALIFMLLLTGFEVHGSYIFLGYENAVNIHIYAAYSLIILIIFAAFWHLTTGEWKQYVPTKENIKAYINYYLVGIFKDAPHPTKKTIISKLNPLQKLTYFGLKIVIIPLLIITGILYLYYRYPTDAGIASMDAVSLKVIAYLHTLGAYLITAFVIAHLYLTTTGHTVFSNINAMLTGYEELDVDNEELDHQIVEKYKLNEKINDKEEK